MNTIVYFVRHAVAPFNQDDYHGRSLAPEGRVAAEALVPLFKTLTIDVLVSSSSPRAIETIQPIAVSKNLSIETHDSLQELLLRGSDTPLPNNDLEGEIQKVFENSSYKLAGGESAQGALGRGLPAFTSILERNAGKTIILGTHGIIMTLLLRSFDGGYGFDFWNKLTKPDVYRAVFNAGKLNDVTRILK